MSPFPLLCSSSNNLQIPSAEGCGTGMDWGRQGGTDTNPAWCRAVLILGKSCSRRIRTNPYHVTEIVRWKFKFLECLSSFVHFWLLRWTHRRYHPQPDYERIYERWSNMNLSQKSQNATKFVFVSLISKYTLFSRYDGQMVLLLVWNNYTHY